MRSENKKFPLVPALLALTAVIVFVLVRFVFPPAGKTGGGKITESTAAVAETGKNTAEAKTAAAADAGRPSAAAATASAAEKETGTVLPAPVTVRKPQKGKIIIASDTHYLAKSLRDGGSAFTQMVEYGDGRLVQYCTEITEAWTEEVIAEKPELLILSGDLTFEGEEESHKEFAKILAKIERAGIPVIVIPGNHDINNHAACSYKGDTLGPVAHVSPEEFASIYADFGYKEAVSRDSASLSYVYQLDQNTRIMMIDSCQYEPKALIGGMIKDDTYAWMENQLADAADKGMTVLTVSHHNALVESEVYTLDCTIEHSERLEELLNKWSVPLHLSGHLHVQHYMKSSGPGKTFTEIVTGSLITPPCCYGILDLSGDGNYSYHTGNVDMEAYAERHQSRNNDLLQFTAFKNEFLEKVFKNQAYGDFEKTGIEGEVTDVDKEDMAGMYARLNAAYYAGKAYKIADEIKDSAGYRKWMSYGYSSTLTDYIEAILNDATKDYNNIVTDGE
jgi:3',5'-cyclic AMP phosphodiesterase CpdA